MTPGEADLAAYLDQLVDEAPPFSERQKDIIATAFHGAFTKKRPAREVGGAAR